MEIDCYAIKTYYKLNNTVHSHTHSYYDSYEEAKQEWNNLKWFYKDKGISNIIFEECNEETAKIRVKAMSEGVQFCTIIKEKGWIRNGY